MVQNFVLKIFWGTGPRPFPMCVAIPNVITLCQTVFGINRVPQKWGIWARP